MKRFLPMIPLMATLAVAAASGAVTIEKTSYQGWGNCYRISNAEVELIVTADVGPRVIRYALIGGTNLFKEYADQLGRTGEAEFQLRGGHRLWVAPENLQTTWAPDNGPVNIRVDGETLTASQPVDAAGFEKQIVVKLAETGSGVELVHRIRNTNPSPVELAPWTLTVMAPGGTAIAAFPPRGKHPEALLPTHPLVMWAYTDLSDRRWTFTKKYLILRQDPRAVEPQKVGLFNAHTWGAYLLGSQLFLKQMKADPAGAYPDFGCSFETFTNADMLELETLGPLTRLATGSSVEQVERWSLHKNIRIQVWSEAELDRVVAPLIAK